MAEQHFSAPTRTRNGVRRTRPPSGVQHIRHHHTERFTVIGNHLLQHPDLSVEAIGLGAHIQSLPDGVPVGIKDLARRFPLGEVRIAAALRELEEYGYLLRQKDNISGNRFITRTFFYDKPRHLADQSAKQQSKAAKAQLKPPRQPRATPRPALTKGLPPPTPAPETAPAGHAGEGRTASAKEFGVRVAAGSAGLPTLPTELQAEAPSAPLPHGALATHPQQSLAFAGPSPLPPHPARYDDTTRHIARELLAGLRRVDQRLTLSERDVTRLTPAVVAWLERGVDPVSIERNLTMRLPGEPIGFPAAFLGRRLTDQLPPPLPAARTQPARPSPVPLQNCPGCDHAFRSPQPGSCPRCQAAEAAKARATLEAFLAS